MRLSALGSDANFVGYNKVPAWYDLSRKKLYVLEPLEPLYQPLIR